MVSRRDAGTDKHDREENSLICEHMVPWLCYTEEFWRNTKFFPDVHYFVYTNVYSILHNLPDINCMEYLQLPRKWIFDTICTSVPLLDFAAFLKWLSCLCTLQDVDSAHES